MFKNDNKNTEEIDLKEYGYEGKMNVTKGYRPTQEQVDNVIKILEEERKKNLN